MPDPRIFPIIKSNTTHATVTNVSGSVLTENAHRGDTDFTNDSAYVIYLARGNPAVIGDGARLNPRGGVYHIGTSNLFYGEVFGIADCDAQVDCNLSIEEGSA